MSRIEELRSSIEKRLDFLEHQALALEAQLTHTKEQALQRLEQRKQQLREVLQRVQVDLQKSKDLAAQVKSEVQAKLEQLQLQLALGKAEARDKFEEQRTRTLELVNEFEALVDRTSKSVAFESRNLLEDLVGHATALEAEFDALKSRFEIEKTRQQAVLESRKQELLDRLRTYRAQIEARRQTVQAKAGSLEHELREGMEQIKAAFKKLFA